MSKPMKSQIIQWFLYEAMKQIQGDWEVTWPPLGGGSLVAVAGGMCQGEAWAWLRASLALLLLLDLSSRASESPDRECCEPLYPFIPIPITPPPPSLTTQPLPTSVTSNRPNFVDVTIEQQEIATRPRPGKAASSTLSWTEFQQTSGLTQLTENFPRVVLLWDFMCRTTISKLRFRVFAILKSWH